MLMTLFPSLVLIASSTAHLVSRFAHINASQIGPAIPAAQGYRIEAFGKGAYMVTDGGYQAFFFVTQESVIVVDAPPSIGYNVLHAIRNITDKPVSHMVYSHSHADHIGAAFILGDSSSLSIIAHKLTAEYLSLTNDASHRPPPTITFEDSYVLRVGNQTLELANRGPNHSPDNIFVYAPVQKVLIFIDVIYPRWTPYNALGEVENVPGYMRAHDEALAYDFDYFVGGHLNWVGTRQDVQIARDYVHDLYNISVLAINMSAQANNSLSVSSVIGPNAAKADPNNYWALNYDYTDALADWVTKQVAARWNTTLLGLDVYGKSHAEAMIESLRIDFGILGPFAVHKS